MQTITKSEILEEFRDRIPVINPRELNRSAERIIEVLRQHLEEGGRIEIRGFGSFGIKHRPPRIGRNPQNGESVHVGARCTAFFKAGKDMRHRVNKSRVWLATVDRNDADEDE